VNLAWVAREFGVGRSWVTRVAQRPARVADLNSRSGNSRVADPHRFEYILIYVITVWTPTRDEARKVIVLGVYGGKGGFGTVPRSHQDDGQYYDNITNSSFCVQAHTSMTQYFLKNGCWGRGMIIRRWSTDELSYPEPNYHCSELLYS